MPTTPLGYLDYPPEGDTDWYTQGQDGLESWLLRVELMGLPTYDTFGDLPTPGSTETHSPSATQTQRQFAAVVADQAIYRDNGTEWVEWTLTATEDSPADELHAVEGQLADAIFVGENEDVAAKLNNAPAGATVVIPAASWSTATTISPASPITVISTGGDITHTGTGPVWEYDDYTTIVGRLSIDAGGQDCFVRAVSLVRDLEMQGVAVDNADTALELPYRRFDIRLTSCINSNVGMHAFKGSSGDQTRFGGVYNCNLTNNDVGFLSDGIRSCEIWARWRSNVRSGITLRGERANHTEFAGLIGQTDGPPVLIENDSANGIAAPDRANITLRGLTLTGNNLNSPPTDLTGPVGMVHVEDYQNFLNLTIDGGQYTDGNNGGPTVTDESGINSLYVTVQGGRGPNASFNQCWVAIFANGEWNGDISGALRALRFDVQTGGGNRPYVENSFGAKSVLGSANVTGGDYDGYAEGSFITVHNGGGDLPEGPAFVNGNGNWVSVMDGSVYTPP